MLCEESYIGGRDKLWWRGWGLVVMEGDYEEASVPWVAPDLSLSD